MKVSFFSWGLYQSSCQCLTLSRRRYVYWLFLNPDFTYSLKIFNYSSLSSLGHLFTRFYFRVLNLVLFRPSCRLFLFLQTGVPDDFLRLIFVSLSPRRRWVPLTSWSLSGRRTFVDLLGTVYSLLTRSVARHPSPVTSCHVPSPDTLCPRLLRSGRGRLRTSDLLELDIRSTVRFLDFPWVTGVTWLLCPYPELPDSVIHRHPSHDLSVLNGPPTSKLQTLPQGSETDSGVDGHTPGSESSDLFLGTFLTRPVEYLVWVQPLSNIEVVGLTPLVEQYGPTIPGVGVE